MPLQREQPTTQVGGGRFNRISTTPLAFYALDEYCKKRLQKIERASKRAQDRWDFAMRELSDPLPSQGLEYVAAARSKRRLLLAAGGATMRGSLLVDEVLTREAAERGDAVAQRELARLEAIRAGTYMAWTWGQEQDASHGSWGDNAAWGDSSGWGLRADAADAADVDAVAAGNDDVGGTAGSVVAAEDGQDDENSNSAPVTRELSPEPWWMTHPGHDLQDADDAPSPPRYALALPFL